MSIFGDRVTVPSGFERYAFLRRLPSEEIDNEGAELASELAVLANRHTSTPDLIWFAIWEGYGWEPATLEYAAPPGRLAWMTRVRERRRRRVAVRDRAGRVREGLAEVPSFDLPLRRYFLVGGPLESVSGIACPDGFGFQVPDLWWPQDRSWFVASDTDLDWSYVGGSDDFVARVLEAFSGRSYSVEWTDPITSIQ